MADNQINKVGQVYHDSKYFEGLKRGLFFFYTFSLIPISPLAE